MLSACPLFTSVSVCLAICLSVCPSLSPCLSLYFSFFFFLPLFLSLSLCLSICPCLCLCAQLYICNHLERAVEEMRGLLSNPCGRCLEETTWFVSLYPETGIHLHRSFLEILCVCLHWSQSEFIPMLKSLLRSQSSNEQEQQRLEANLQSQQKEELIIEKKTLAGKLQNYLTVSQMRYEPGVEIGSQVQVSTFYF